MYYIGIDPGKHTGLAVWDTSIKQFTQVCSLPIHKALHYVWSRSNTPVPSVTVVFEDARQRKWYTSNSNARKQGAGSVKRDCAIWEDFCVDMDIPYIKVAPHRGMTKLSAEQFRYLTNWTGRTNDHARDAAMLVFQR